MHWPGLTVLPACGTAQGETHALLCTTCGVPCAVVDARGNPWSRQGERPRGSLAYVCGPGAVARHVRAFPRCSLPSRRGGPRMYFRVLAESKSSPLCPKYRARQRLRGDHKRNRARVHEPCRSAELFTVDKRKTRGKIHASGFRLGKVCFTSPR